MSVFSSTFKEPFRNPFGSPFNGPGVGGGAAPYSPLSLFASGEQGAWYDPSDFSTMFQDAAGTTPVTGAGQSVGRILDKSGRGNHATQANASNKPILQSIGGKLALVFDGVDDFLSTGSIDFTSTDKMTVVAGVRKLSDAAGGMLLELSANFNGTAGSLYLLSHDSGGREWASSARGTATAALGHAAWDGTLAPDTAVLSVTHDIAGDLSRMRRNGVVRNDGTADKGAGNFNNQALYIGRRAGTSFPFNGHLYQLVVRGALTADLAPIESFTADKTGVTLL